MSFNMNQWASSYWALATFNDVQEGIHGLQRPRKQLYPYRKGNKPQIARDTEGLQRDRAEKIRTRFCIRLTNRHVTIKLCHYFVHRFGIFTSTPPYAVIVEDCLITHVKHQLEWFPTVCGESNLCPFWSFVRTTIATFSQGICC
jgi:hypothetical protein